ncbi:SSU ribosomal protein S30P;sigma 54 modulation protein [Thermaerobacter marianensis DSM 12885]|uniref:Ribosome hibernation promoting factor n=1 Tax=Thermaerobacter marianensis (strain ATCC 700841 / DSM 12885 / JCM 10246 / 7p75a) TaxID=644966 RepID=E6SLQ5_THEM7|nr:ribosome-associated translation inhibitor RaiA [Thermaerobacter marianensis]ADU50322.1 SSU ribosomal protein S30P;sigma 54 modulation protein [Thermaerobacter marianensis DSM 12885]
MNISIYGKNVDVTEALKEYARRKVGKVARYFTGTPLQAQVTLSIERDRHIVEVTIPVPNSGLLIRAEEESDDMYASIDLVVDKLERQIRKFKTRLNRKARRLEATTGQAVPEADAPVDEPDWTEGEEEGRVVRTKRFAVKPMTVDEAILQMNLLGHDFFVFANATTGEINVLYRRRDGQYGLIEPEF